MHIRPGRKEGQPQLHILLRACQKHPVIDNHAHNVLKSEHRNKFPILNMVSEAEGKGLDDAIHTLAGACAVNALGSLYSMEDKDQDAQEAWDEIAATRDTIDYAYLCQRCFADIGIHCILMDEGICGTSEYAEPYRWHDQFTASPTKRIIRIEVIAESILVNIIKMSPKEDDTPIVDVLGNFTAKFDAQINAFFTNPDVVGLKSIACYRTGLDINFNSSVSAIEEDLKRAIDDYWNANDGTIRLAHKAFNDHFVRLAIKIAGKHKKPIQFHTGLGDPSIILSLSTPSLLQPIICACPDTTFVLLHASYPFTREAGYLAAMYPNVYLDWGEVGLQVSTAGQKRILEMILELCPASKVMWSSDAHWWPEAYYISTRHARGVLYDVLAEYVSKEEISESMAVSFVQKILFENANRLYNLCMKAES